MSRRAFMKMVRELDVKIYLIKIIEFDRFDYMIIFFIACRPSRKNYYSLIKKKILSLLVFNMSRLNLQD